MFIINANPTYRCNNFPLYFNHIKCAMAMLIWLLMVFAVVDLTTATVTPDTLNVSMIIVTVQKLHLMV